MVAGAGSGKTKSLVDRILTLVVVDGVPLERIAAVTFTEKAGAELRDRLRAKLEERERTATVASEVERARIARDELDIAAIGTLHAFAQRVLQLHPIEAQLPPEIAVLDEVGSSIAMDAGGRRSSSNFSTTRRPDPRSNVPSSRRTGWTPSSRSPGR